MDLKRELGLRDIILFNIVAIVGLRWISNAAAGGISSVLLWIMAALCFFIPQGLTVMELSRIYPSEGGIYQWTKNAFGDFHGFLCGWFYWTGNLIYYPTLLIYTAGTSVYIFGDKFLYLEKNSFYTLFLSLFILWTAISLNTIGMATGKWVQNLGAISTWVPIFIIIFIGITITLTGGFSNPFTFKDLIPDFGNIKLIAFFSTLCFAFGGLELAPLMGDEIKEPEKTLPKGIIISGIIIAFIYIGGTISLLAAVPGKDISVITGILQGISIAEKKVGIGGITSIVAFCIVIASTGGIGAWISGSARIPFMAGIDNFLPSSFGKIHPRWHTPYIAMIWQGIISSVFLIMSIAGSTIKEAYTLLLDMTIIILFIPYIYMFLTFIIVKRKEQSERGFTPGGKCAIWLIGIMGLSITLLSILLSFNPPKGTVNVLLYEIKLIGGSLLFLLIAIVLYYKQKIHPEI